ncbi:amidohydrolase family protein [Sinomonas sp. RB5]
MEEIVDTHLHFWDPARLHYPWLREAPGLDRPFMPPDLDTGGVPLKGFVFVEADRSPEQRMQETDWAVGLAHQDPRLLAVVASVALTGPQDVRPQLRELEQKPLVKGVRGLFQDQDPSLITAPDTLRAAQAVAQAGLAFDACIRHSQLATLTAFAATVPELPVVLDHMGKPPIRTGGHREWATALKELAALPNTFVKLSGAAPEADPDKDLSAQSLPYLRAALDAFGPHRSMFGSDWPVSSTRQGGLEPAAAYREWAEIVLGRATDGLSTQDQAAVASGTAQRFYGIDSKEPSR